MKKAIRLVHLTSVSSLSLCLFLSLTSFLLPLCSFKSRSNRVRFLSLHCTNHVTRALRGKEQRKEVRDAEEAAPSAAVVLTQQAANGLLEAICSVHFVWTFYDLFIQQQLET